MHDPNSIYGFRGQNYYLSNYAPSAICIENIWYPTVEHAFAAMKTFDIKLRRSISTASSPGEAKLLGRRLDLRHDWEEVKDDIMLSLVRLKFSFYHNLGNKLMNTGSLQIIEANKWNDLYWGVDFNTGKGLNKLGTILMIVRQELQRNKRREIDGSTISIAYLRKT